MHINSSRANPLKCIVFLLVLLVLCLPAAAFATQARSQKPGDNPKHPGRDVTPDQAYKMTLDNSHAFIVDVRCRPEYVLIGHPTVAHHVPIRFWTGKHVSKGYGMILNQHFYQDLAARFNPATDVLIFMCRSGGRSCEAAKAAVKGGWPAEKVYNMLGGFEGGKLKNKLSIYNGMRKLGGWKNLGLPWTYGVNPKLAYPETK